MGQLWLLCVSCNVRHMFYDASRPKAFIKPCFVCVCESSSFNKLDRSTEYLPVNRDTEVATPLARSSNDICANLHRWLSSSSINNKCIMHGCVNLTGEFEQRMAVTNTLLGPRARTHTRRHCIKSNLTRMSADACTIIIITFGEQNSYTHTHHIMLLSCAHRIALWKAILMTIISAFFLLLAAHRGEQIVIIEVSVPESNITRLVVV